MKKILLIDGIYPINTRNKRILKTLQTKYIVKYCAWNRENIPINEQANYIYSSNEGYGKKIKKLLGMKKYLEYIKNIIKEFKPDIIIASQWDMLFLVNLSGFNGKIIYENIDLPSSKNILILGILLKLEKFLLKKVDGIIFASRFFEPLYAEYKKDKLILENLPLREIDFTEEIKKEERNKIRISFIGGLRYFEVMKNLLLAVQEIENIEVYLIGKGPENDKFRDFIISKNLKNVTMIDRYIYEEIKRYYLNTDLLWSVYPTKDYNVKYAISNKFFESLLFEVPCFFSENIFLGQLVKEYQIGIVVNPYKIDSIKKLLRNLNQNKILELKNNLMEYKKNKKIYWEEKEEELFKFIEVLK